MWAAAATYADIERETGVPVSTARSWVIGTRAAPGAQRPGGAAHPRRPPAEPVERGDSFAGGLDRPVRIDADIHNWLVGKAIENTLSVPRLVNLILRRAMEAQ